MRNRLGEGQGHAVVALFFLVFLSALPMLRFAQTRSQSHVY